MWVCTQAIITRDRNRNGNKASNENGTERGWEPRPGGTRARTHTELYGRLQKTIRAYETNQIINVSTRNEQATIPEYKGNWKQEMWNLHSTNPTQHIQRGRFQGQLLMIVCQCQ